MKKIMFALIALIGFSFAASAQTAAPVPQPRPQFARLILEVPSLTTNDQFVDIKPVLEKTEGVRYVNLDANRHQVFFSYDPSIISAKKISELLQQKGLTNTINLTTETPAVAPAKQ